MIIIVALCSCGHVPHEEASSPFVVDSAVTSVASTADAGIVMAYAFAVREYIGKLYKPGERAPDTIYIGRHPGFPHIMLPDTISGKQIKVIDGDSAVQVLRHRKGIVYLNIMSWLESGKAEFLIVTFHDFRPQHNMHLYFNRQRDSVALDSFGMEYPYGLQPGGSG